MAERGDDKKPPKTRKSRSPNYPSVDLATAVAKVRELHPKIGRHEVTAPDLMSELGYSAKSSSGLQLIATLGAFGLFESEGRGDDRRFSVSQDAVRIIHEPEDSSERAAALQRCALRPQIHQKLWEKYGRELPKSDQVIRSFLIVDQDFNEDAATQLISEYRTTFQYAALDDSGSIENNNGGVADNGVEGQIMRAAAPAESTARTPRGGDYPPRIPYAVSEPIFEGEDSRMATETSQIGDETASIAWPKGMTPEQYEDFEYWINGVLRKAKRSVMTPTGSPEGDDE